METLVAIMKKDTYFECTIKGRMGRKIPAGTEVLVHETRGGWLRATWKDEVDLFGRFSRRVYLDDLVIP